MSLLSEILLALFVLNLGTAFGAGLYESRIIIPQWFRKGPGTDYYIDTVSMNKTDVGRKFWGLVTTGPLTLLTLANIVLAWQSPQPIHNWWLAAALIALLERLGTFAFFIPNAIKFQRSDERPIAGISRLVTMWIGLNYVRLALNLIAWLVSLIAFSYIQLIPPY